MKKIILSLAALLILSGCFPSANNISRAKKVKAAMEKYHAEAAEMLNLLGQTEDSLDISVGEFYTLTHRGAVTEDDFDLLRQQAEEYDQLKDQYIQMQDNYIARLENLAGGLLDPKERVIQQRHDVLRMGIR